MNGSMMCFVGIKALHENRGTLRRGLKDAAIMAWCQHVARIQKPSAQIFRDDVGPGTKHPTTGL